MAAGMRTTTIDEELNAMLQRDVHHNPHANQTTLAGYMALTSSPGMMMGVGTTSEHMLLCDGDFSSQLLYPSQQIIDPKNRVMKIAAHIRANNNPMFRPLSDATSQGNFGGGGGGGLQRYHSAPGSFLQSLVDEVDTFEDAFSQVSSPLRNNNNLAGNRIDPGLRDHHHSLMVPSFFSRNNNNNNNNDNLMSITEGIPQPMETGYDQFLSPPMESEKRSSTLVTSMFGVKQESKPAANRLQAGDNPLHRLAAKENLFRQSSLPADWFATLQDTIDDLNSQIPFMTSPEESLSGGISEEMGTAGMIVGGKSSSVYSSRDDSFLVSDITSLGAGSGMWNSLTSPVGLGGKQLRGVVGKTTVDRGVSLGPDEEGNIMKGRLGLQPGSLIRHSSLCATINSSLSETFFDNLADVSVPCRTRAKRGYATHPRSIAERVRRTKISERMKRLQDLVPNMDKQTNTSDMLDEAVEYVKQLKQQVRELSDTVVQLREMEEVKGIKAKVGT